MKDISNIKELIEKLDNEEKVFGNLTPRKFGIVSFHSWHDPINRDERYMDHRLCRSIANDVLREVPEKVMWRCGYAGNTTKINLNYLRAYANGSLDELLAEEEKKRREEETLKLKNEKAKKCEKLFENLPDKVKCFARGLSGHGFSGDEKFFLQDNLIVVSRTKWDTSTKGVGQYCTPSTVTDYHVRETWVFKINDERLEKIDSCSERKLFRTTERGVVARHYSTKVEKVTVEDKKVVVLYEDGGCYFN